MCNHRSPGFGRLVVQENGYGEQVVWAEEELAGLFGLLIAVLALLIVHLLLRICVSVSKLSRSCCGGCRTSD
ncbi:hypothetical protein FJT64_015802 [Amphibalanus amphitrite]|uniref:Uncharacterized protein n=1 Tax=Amphibalanus amphitrite TaxID=1232801 RepID=A0A6A4XCD2_AMPAM|nr:hypothetical protein FJT64_015802 [Amphibalanus amphitrite]